MKIKNKNILYCLFLAAIFMIFIFASYFSLETILGNAYIHDQSIKVLISFICLIIIFSFILNKLKLTKKQIAILFIILILVGLSLRVFSMYTLKTVQISDFANSERLYNYLQENGEFQYHENPADNVSLQNNFAMFPTWYIYSAIIVQMFNIVGYNAEYIIELNLMLVALASLFLYKGVSRLFSSKIALLSIFFFSICPSLITYSNIGTPDHFTILLICALIFCWSFVLKENNKKKKYLQSIILILIMSLINLFKPLSIYMLLVFVCSEILINIFGNLKNIKKYFKLNWKYLSFFIISFLIINTSITQMANLITEKNIKMTIKDSSGMYLLWGYTLNENKEYDSNYIYNQIMPELLKKYEYDYDKVLSELSIIAKQNLKNNIKYIPNIWEAKFKILFANEGDYFSFANTNEKYSEKLSLNYYNDYIVVSNSFMGITYILICISCIGSIITEKSNKETSIIYLMIIGFIAIVILGGVQSRYKSLISVQFFIMAAIGIEYLWSIINLVKIKIKKKKGEISINVGIGYNSSLQQQQTYKNSI